MVIEIINENTIKAKIPCKVKGGTTTQEVLMPLNAKSTILNPGTIKVTVYRATAYPTHLKKPNVIRFKGRRSILITGLIIRVVNARATPVNITVVKPFSKTNPEATREIRYKLTEFSIKNLSALLIV